MTSEEEQKQNRQTQIPKLQAVIEVKNKVKEYQFVFVVMLISGVFSIIGSFVSNWIAVILGLGLFGIGLWFSKKQNDYLHYLKDKYGV